MNLQHKFRPVIPCRVRGSALIFSLLIVTLVTILVVGFLSMSRLERLSSRSHLERTRAGIIAQNSVEQVVAMLGEYTLTGSYGWVSKPGALIVTSSTVSPLGVKASQTALLPLYSGTAADSDGDAINLNVKSMTEKGQYLLASSEVVASGTAPRMRVKWIYVKEDGIPSRILKGTTEGGIKQYVWQDNPAYNDSDKPVVGRYAYWVDDESAKLNVNTTWSRNDSKNQSPPGSLSRVSLDALDGITPDMATKIFSAVVGSGSNKPTGRLSDYGSFQRFFNSPFESKAAANGDAVMLDALKKNSFALTHYNHSEDSYLNYWGEPKIVLTCIPERAKRWVRKDDGTWERIQLPFLDILPADVLALPVDQQPEYLGRRQADGNQYLDWDKLQKTVEMVTKLLRRTDWPMVKGNAVVKSFKDKHYGYLKSYDPLLQESRAVTLALCLIDYVRVREYKVPAVANMDSKLRQFDPEGVGLMAPLAGYLDFDASGNGTLVPGSKYNGGNGTGAYGKYKVRGTTRAPFITELGVWVNPSGAMWMQNYSDNEWSSVRFWVTNATLVMEVHLPACYGILSMPLTDKYAIQIEGSVPASRYNLQTDPTLRAKHVPSLHNMYSTASTPIKVEGAGNAYNGTVKPGKTRLVADDYVAIKMNTTMDMAGYDAGTDPESVKPEYPWSEAVRPWGKICPLRVSLDPVNWWTWVAGVTNPTDNISGVVPPSNPDALAWVQYRIDDTSVSSVDNISSVEVDDPRVSDHRENWKQNTRNTFGQPNSISTLGKLPVNGQDTDNGGRVTDHSLYFPPPAGTKITYPDGFTDDNTVGMVTSVAELGYVCMGITSGRNFSGAGVPEGVPWRSLKMTGENVADGELPDWALLNCFTVPQSEQVSREAATALTPHGRYRAGRVNLNANIEPFGVSRKGVLQALFLGAKKAREGGATVSASQAASLADAMLGMEFHYPEEMAAMDVLGNDGEASEELLREILDLTTVRSNVFSVYSVGQALKQLPTGGFTVTAEQRKQTVLERYETPVTGSTGNVLPGTLRFRTVYERSLNP